MHVYAYKHKPVKFKMCEETDLCMLIRCENWQTYAQICLLHARTHTYDWTHIFVHAKLYSKELQVEFVLIRQMLRMYSIHLFIRPSINLFSSYTPWSFVLSLDWIFSGQSLLQSLWNKLIWDDLLPVVFTRHPLLLTHSSVFSLSHLSHSLHEFKARKIKC